MKTYVDFKGTRIFFQAAGKGPAVVFIHGFLESSRVWKNFTRRLSGQFRVITIDLPGHGKSGFSGSVLSMDDMATAVRHVLKSLDISSCVLVGHSMGGYVTLAFAEKHPAMLRGFVLFHSQAAADSAEARNNRERTIKLVENDHAGFISNFIPGLFDPANVDKLNGEIDILKNLARETPTAGITAALEGMKIRPDRQHVLANTKVPVLFIIGKNDKRILMETVIPQTLLPVHSEMLLLDHVGHMGFIEEPKKTADAIKGFALRVF